MTGQHTTGAIRQLQHLLREGTVAGLTDRQLLERFASGRDEASFSALVGRHGPMVLGVCRRIVGDDAEAEDAFQAAFLVLARKAGTIRVDDSLGRWLYTVTRRIALRAGAATARRSREEPADDSLPAPDLGPRAACRDLLAALDEEMGRLPASYRSVLVLCYLEGLTHEEAARRLGWPLGTVKGRLARARSLLRERLVRRGLSLSTGALAASLGPATVSATLMEGVVSAAVGFAAGRATEAGAFPAAIVLAKEALRTMSMAKMKLAATAVLAFGVGVGVAGSGLGHLPGGAARLAFADEPALPSRSGPAPAAKAGGNQEDAPRAGSPPAAEAVREIERIDGMIRNFDTLIDESRGEITKLEGRVQGQREAIEELDRRRRFLATKRAEAEAKLGHPAPKTPPPVAPARPRTEGMKRAFPDYVVEPPDIISVEVHDALPGRPIKGERLVRPDGKISLQFYGEVYVAGLTTAQIKEKVVLHLRKYLPDAGLGLIKREGDRSIAVDPKETPAVAVEVVSYNSKVYYVQGEVGSPGRFPFTGNETVLDAINYGGGLLPTAAAKSIHLIRLVPGTTGQFLPVNLDAIVKSGDVSTNYQIFPGDRIIVDRSPPSPQSPQDKSARHRQMEDRIDAMIRELEAFRRELKEGP